MVFKFTTLCKGNNMTNSTEKKLLEFRRQYIEWGNILIPYGSSKKDRSKFVYHLPAGVEVYTPILAVYKMIEVYICAGIEVGADLNPTQIDIDEAMAATRINDISIC